MFHALDGIYFDRTTDGGYRLVVRESALEGAPVLREVVLDADTFGSVARLPVPPSLPPQVVCANGSAAETEIRVEGDLGEFPGLVVELDAPVPGVSITGRHVSRDGSPREVARFPRLVTVRPFPGAEPSDQRTIEFDVGDVPWGDAQP